MNSKIYVDEHTDCFQTASTVDSVIAFVSACNVVASSDTEPFTLRNYGRRVNCTFMAIYPAVVRTVALDVGSKRVRGGAFPETETGTIHQVMPVFYFILKKNIIFIFDYYRCNELTIDSYRNKLYIVDYGNSATNAARRTKCR